MAKEIKFNIKLSVDSKREMRFTQRIWKDKEKQHKAKKGKRVTIGQFDAGGGKIIPP